MHGFVNEIETSKQYDLMLNASKNVDFGNFHDIVGYSTLILSAANEADILMTGNNLQSTEAIKITLLAKEWVNNVNNHICDWTVGEAMDITEPYDFMYRIAHRTPTPQGFTYKFILKAFEALIHGDKTVNEYHLFSFIRQQIERRDKAFFGRPLDWYSISLDRWFNSFPNGSSIKQHSDYDILEIISILMREDLFMFTANQNLFKEKLFKNHRHYLNKIDRLSSQELIALSQFLTWSGKFLPYEEKSNYELALLRAQIAHPDTNRFYRLTLQHNLALMNED